MPLNAPSEDPVEYAEQALLGALLHQPDHLPAITRQLHGQDWSLPTHQALYQAINHHPTPHTETERHTWYLTVTTTATRKIRTFTPAYASTLLNCCPDPANARAYARMVLAGSIRRTIARHAHRLAQAARIDTAGGLQPDNTLAAHRELADAVRQATARWGATASHHVTLPATERSASAPPSQTRDEEGLLAALAASPDSIHHTARWLTPDDFCHDRHKIIYECMTTLRHRGDPIDPVTLTWEAQQLGALAHNRLTPQGIRHLTAPRSGDSAYWADRLLKTALIRTAATAGTAVRTAAEERSTAPDTLLAACRTATARIDEAHQRWRGHREDASETRGDPAQPVVHYGRAVTPPGNSVPAEAPRAAHRRPK
ncbi:DnaB-like helicase N-terminal domain-containing protein [Streptomyces carpaticus]|uniref:DnaB-like helicase N-terminal domain-containing protein n=1 Tax=Streptomyces carpaticus TaxID=285558 RepID=UPI0031F93C21